MEGFAEGRVAFDRRIDKRPDPALLRNRRAVQEPDLVAVDRIPGGGTVCVVVGLSAGIPGGFGEQDRSDIALPAHEKVVAAVHPLFDPEVFGPYGQVRRHGGEGLGQAGEDEEKQDRFRRRLFHTPIIGGGMWVKHRK